MSPVCITRPNGNVHYFISANNKCPNPMEGFLKFLGDTLFKTSQVYKPKETTLLQYVKQNQKLAITN